MSAGPEERERKEGGDSEGAFVKSAKGGGEGT